MDGDDAGAPRSRRARRMLVKWGVIAMVAGSWLGYRAWRRAHAGPPPPLAPRTDPTSALLRVRLAAAPIDTQTQTEARLVEPFTVERLDAGGDEIRLRVRGAVQNTGSVPRAIGVLLALVSAEGVVLTMARLETATAEPGATVPFEIAPFPLDPAAVAQIARWQVLLRGPKSE